MFSMFSFHVLHPRSCKHKLGSPTFKVLWKIGDDICSRSLAKNGDQLNENPSRETIFLATTQFSGIPETVNVKPRKDAF